MKVRAACILTFRIFPPVNPARCYQGVSESPPCAKSGLYEPEVVFYYPYSPDYLLADSSLNCQRPSVFSKAVPA